MYDLIQCAKRAFYQKNADDTWCAKSTSEQNKWITEGIIYE